MKKKGSAIITVIGAVTVLIIFAFAFIGSSREKAGISRLMSDEKKCEALAESATDFILQYIKKNANKHNDIGDMAPIYYLLRAPLKEKGSSGSGENIILDVSDTKKIELNDCIPFMNIIEPSIKEIGWENVKVTSTCELCNAEAFAPEVSDYKVTTINNKHLPAVGNSAKFLDDLSGSCSEASTSDWKPSQWNLQIKLPEGDLTEERFFYDLDFRLDLDFKLFGKEFSIPIAEVPLTDIKVVVTRQGDESSCVFDVNVDFDQIKNFKYTIPIIDKSFYPFRDFIISIENKIAKKLHSPIDLQDKMDKSKLFPDISPKTLQGLKNAYTSGEPEYNFSGYKNSMTDRKSKLQYDTCLNNGNIDSLSDFSTPYYLEKGGVLRITTKVEYNKSESKKIERTLVAEIPFKASDVQPIGPEYSFFVANTRKVSNPNDIVGFTLGEPIELNKKTNNKASFYDSTPPAGQFIVHNVPITSDNKVDYTALDDTRVPGMVRINCDYTPTNNKVSQLRSFFGIIDQPELTEFNKFFTPFDSLNETNKRNNFNTLLSFCWEGDDQKTTPQRYHDIELPVIFDTENVQMKHKLVGQGVKDILKFVESAGFEILSVPTLLFGICHMGYPLGIRVEGPVDSIFSRTRIYINPHGVLDDDLGFEDETEVYYDYENVTNFVKNKNSAYAFDNSDKPTSRDNNRAVTYGMLGTDGSPLAGYDKTQTWDSSNDPQYCPANCYDALQYAKKATKYYETASEFLADFNVEVAKGGLKGTGGYLEFNGVYYIKEDVLNLGSIKYKGNGLIVCKKSININQNILKDESDNESSLGIIARNGVIKFGTSCSKVMAACFSNNAPICNSSKLNIYGNLVCGVFKRDAFGVDTYINYDNRICSVTPLASHRKVGKFEPKRYAVAFADNWSKFVYDKKRE